MSGNILQIQYNNTDSQRQMVHQGRTSILKKTKRQDLWKYGMKFIFIQMHLVIQTIQNAALFLLCSYSNIHQYGLQFCSFSTLGFDYYPFRRDKATDIACTKVLFMTNHSTCPIFNEPSLLIGRFYWTVSIKVSYCASDKP